MQNLGCILRNLTNICLHKSASAEEILHRKRQRYLGKIRKDMAGGPSILFTRNAVVDGTRIRKSSIICKPFVGIDASQLYPCSLCQLMPITSH